VASATKLKATIVSSSLSDP